MSFNESIFSEAKKKKKKIKIFGFKHVWISFYGVIGFERELNS